MQLAVVKGSGAEAQEPTTQSPPKWHWLPSGQPDCASDQTAGYSLAKESGSSGVDYGAAVARRRRMFLKVVVFCDTERVWRVVSGDELFAILYPRLQGRRLSGGWGHTRPSTPRASQRGGVIFYPLPYPRAHARPQPRGERVIRDLLPQPHVQEL